MDSRSFSLVPIVQDKGLFQYLERIKRFPMLEAEEEYRLARLWRDFGDRQAAHVLVTSHLRQVASIALRYRGYGLPMNEVISEGNIGLMQAVKRFDPEKGFRLSTYAVWWIKAAIQEFILRSWSLVKIGTTSAQKKLFFGLRRAKRQIEAAHGGEFKPEHVSALARTFGVADSEITSMDVRLSGDSSLNTRVGHEGEGEELQDLIADRSINQELTLLEEQETSRKVKLLTSALAALGERERTIFEARRLQEPPVTLEDLSQKFDISRERVRQIEARAFEKIKASIKSVAASLFGRG